VGFALSANAASALDETMDCAMAEGATERPPATTTHNSIPPNDFIPPPNEFENRATNQDCDMGNIFPNPEGI
jgi:hypothetical protein